MSATERLPPLSPGLRRVSEGWFVAALVGAVIFANGALGYWLGSRIDAGSTAPSSLSASTSVGDRVALLEARRALARVASPGVPAQAREVLLRSAEERLRGIGDPRLQGVGASISAWRTAPGAPSAPAVRRTLEQIDAVLDSLAAGTRGAAAP